MKIVHVITGLDGGGAQYFLYRLLPHLAAHHQCEVISLSGIGPMGEKIRALGIPVSAVDMRKSAFGLGGFFALRRMLKEARPDLVHTWMYHSDLLGGLAARSLGIKPVVWAIHSPDVDERYIKLRTRVIARICATLAPFVPAQIVSCSADAWAKHARFGYRARNVTVIPNGFDVSQFHPDPDARNRIRAEFGLSADTPVVGMVARFHEQKGHKDFFAIARMLLARRPDVRFLLAGRGITGENAALMDWMNAAGVQQAVTLAGPRNDVASVLSALDVLVSPSLGEAFPLIIGETMACGVPCVATDVGDTAYIIGTAGVATPPGDPAAMADALARILNMPKTERETLSAQARLRIVENFEIGLVARKYEEVYERTLGDRGRPKAASPVPANA
ncbi:MAG TPA: glycosyltransferase [Rhizomicrobium sp.]|nr:glycosyltransferase [Rhizomicrobium sp.]